MTLVDNAPPITFADLARRFAKLGLTADAYRRRFKLPLAFADIVNPKLASEIVGYRPLITWYFHGRKAPSSTKTPMIS
jgi:hypothetical protein